MKKPKTSWRKRALVAEKMIDAYRNKLLAAEKERDAYGQVNNQIEHLKAELAARPTVEKIVEKEVLPFSAWMSFMVVSMILMAILISEGVWIYRLKEPILQPYAVQVVKHDFDLPYALRLNEQLNICHDAWRSDEREIKRLKRRLEP